MKQPFYGGFGLIATGGIPKPSFDAFQLLHQLGEERIPVDSNSVLVTRRKDGSLVVAAWNLVPPDQKGSSMKIRLRFEHLDPSRRAHISVVDRDHGDVHPAYEKMGEPRYPSQEQIRMLRQAAQLPPAEVRELRNGELTLDLAADGLALIEIE